MSYLPALIKHGLTVSIRPDGALWLEHPNTPCLSRCTKCCLTPALSNLLTTSIQNVGANAVQPFLSCIYM